MRRPAISFSSSRSIRLRTLGAAPRPSLLCASCESALSTSSQLIDKFKFSCFLGRTVGRIGSGDSAFTRTAGTSEGRERRDVGSGSAESSGEFEGKVWKAWGRGGCRYVESYRMILGDGRAQSDMM